MPFVLFFLAVASASSVGVAGVCLANGNTLRNVLSAPAFRVGTIIVGTAAVIGGLVVRGASARWDYAALGALVPAGLFLIWFRGMRRRAIRMTNPSREEVAGMVEELRRGRPKPGTTSMLFEVSATTLAKQLYAVHQYAAVAETLKMLDWSLIKGLVLIDAATLLSSAYLSSGLVAQARETLELARKEVNDCKDGFDSHDALIAFTRLDARILVHERKPNKALKRLATINEGAGGIHVDTLLVHIHAAAAKGEDERAMKLIGSLREAAGPNALAFLTTPEGPASAMATALFSRNAYR